MAGFDRKGHSRALKGLYDELDAGPAAQSALSGLTVQEWGAGPSVRKTVLTFTNVAIALADEAGVVAYKGQKVYDWPEGYIMFLGAVANLAITKSSAGVNADADGDFGLGTTTAGNNNALATTEQNLIPTTPMPQMSDGATTAKGVSTTTEASKILDGSAGALDVFLNFLIDDADHDVTGTPCNLIVNGTIEILWSKLGDV